MTIQDLTLDRERLITHTRIFNHDTSDKNIFILWYKVCEKGGWFSRVIQPTNSNFCTSQVDYYLFPEINKEPSVLKFLSLALLLHIQKQGGRTLYVVLCYKEKTGKFL